MLTSPVFSGIQKIRGKRLSQYCFLPGFTLFHVAAEFREEQGTATPRVADSKYLPLLLLLAGEKNFKEQTIRKPLLLPVFYFPFLSPSLAMPALGKGQPVICQTCTYVHKPPSLARTKQLSFPKWSWAACQIPSSSVVAECGCN